MKQSPDFAKYPLYEWEAELDRKAVVEHLGMLTARYPNVCSLIHWLKDETRRGKAAALIRALAEKPL